MWAAEGERSLIDLLSLRLDKAFGSYLALLFVLNFAWLPSAWIAADAGAGVVRLLRRRAAYAAGG